MEGHAPFPYPEQNQRIIYKAGEVVKKDVAESRAQHYTQSDVEQQVIDL